MALMAGLTTTAVEQLTKIGALRSHERELLNENYRLEHHPVVVKSGKKFRMWRARRMLSTWKLSLQMRKALHLISKIRNFQIGWKLVVQWKIMTTCKQNWPQLQWSSKLQMGSLLPHLNALPEDPVACRRLRLFCSNVWVQTSRILFRPYSNKLNKAPKRIIWMAKAIFRHWRQRGRKTLEVRESRLLRVYIECAEIL